jgi:hypothetical protein
VPHPMCGSGARWCARADAIFDVPGMHILDVDVDEPARLVLTVESGQLEHTARFTSLFLFEDQLGAQCRPHV